MFIYTTRRSTALLVLINLVWTIGSLRAAETDLTAIDIVLKPDATMSSRAQESNAQLLKDYPQGFALDASHSPHITLLQRYVKTSDLNKVFDAANKVIRKEKPTHWRLNAFKYYYGKVDRTGLAGIVVKPTENLLRLQKELIEAVAPYSVPLGSAAAFATTPEEPSINSFTIDWVSTYIEKASGEKFNPHVTTGVGTIGFLDKLLAEPFKPFSFSPAGVSIYQLGDNGTARKELKSLGK